MLAEALVMVLLPLLLAAAAFWDLASFTIPNLLQLLLLAGFALFALAAGLGAGVLGLHLLAGLVGLCVGFALFALGYIGGGDAKLFAAVVLWLGFRDFASYALVASVLGGVFTLAMIGMRKLPLPAFLRWPWLLRLHDERAGIPYGVALALGVFVILPQTEIFRLAAMG
jgi:prepilin peptidase CpaA